VDTGIEPFKIAAALVGVVAQRLIRTVCQSCKTFIYASAELLETIHFQGDRRRSFVRGEGCPKCHDTGYSGRTGIYEVMPVDREIRELISRRASTDEIRDCYRRHGGRTLLEQGIRLAEKESTSLEEVMRVAYFE
jgi:type II secretory ATPase GspE/PulE/Tfp pilus assembly ATPase PilB-like protein